MDGHGITLTPGATLHFGSLGFVYTGPVESVAGRTFGRPPRPNVLTGQRDARPSSEASRTTSSSACWGQTQHMSVLGSPPITSPTSLSKTVEMDRWAGGIHGAVLHNVPSWATRPTGRPGNGLRRQPPRHEHRPWVYNYSEGTDCAMSWPHKRVQRLRGPCVEQLQIGACTTPSWCRCPAASPTQRIGGGTTPAR
jgi:hypothetical protein